MNNSVGIITFHCAYNYGSALQAFALKEYVSELGFNTSIIDYVDEQDFEQYRLFRTKSYIHYPKFILSDIILFPNHLKRKLAFNYFAKSKLDLTISRFSDCEQLKALNSIMDIFICGSDQIWNLDCTGGIRPAFFLEFAADDKRKIAYAPSLAHAKFRKDYSEELKPLLARIDYLSVREKSSVEYVQSIAGRRVEQVIDPTLLLEKKQYSKIEEKIREKEPYVFVYMIEKNNDLIQYSEEFAKHKKLKLIFLTLSSVTRIKGKNVYGISPGEFVSYIKNAEYVITNSFHATVFSILYEKKFMTFKTGLSASRMVDLLSELKLTDRLKKERVDDEIDYDDARMRLSRLKENSAKYLKNALEL